MREIKFRVWDIEEKRMIKSEKIARLHFNNGLCYAIMGWNGQALFKKFKLIQYTGLKDKNGKEIYEGDIVKYIPRRQIWKAVVVFEDGRFTVKDRGSRCDNFQFSMCEIIGNIYENPELVK